MTESEERFERIEKSLVAVAESQVKTNATLGTLAESLTKTNQMVTELVQSVKAYVDSSRTRMERTEANLDNLIRLIASEHENGKKK